jgi:hypothetical protein
MLSHLLLDQSPDQQREQKDQPQGFDPGWSFQEDGIDDGIVFEEAVVRSMPC